MIPLVIVSYLSGLDQYVQQETWIVSNGDSNKHSEVTEKFQQIILTPELSKRSRILRNRLDLMMWSMHVTTDD